MTVRRSAAAAPPQGVGQFGGVEHNTQPGHTPQWKYPKISSAYMLVYVRESAIPEINVDVSADDVAAHLRHALEQEQAEKARKKKERMEAHLYTVVRVATAKDLAQQIGGERYFDLVSHEEIGTSLRIKKENTLLEVKQEIWRATGVRPTQQRLWVWAKRQNHTFRPDKPLQARNSAQFCAIICAILRNSLTRAFFAAARV